MPVRITLAIPTDADPDDYFALLRAQIAPAGEGAQVGAAAAAQLTFTVEPSTILEAWLLRGRRALGERAPWSYLVLGIAAVAAPVWWLGRRYRLGLRVERRSRMRLLLVLLGGALGSGARYLVATALARARPDVPLGTLASTLPDRF
jgi:hypothetical protein